MENQPLKRTILSGVFWKFGERFLAQGVSFLVSVILARLLTPDDYGIVAMVMIFITIADVFVTSGFATALIQKKDSDETDFSTMFYCSFIVSILIYILVFFLSPVIAAFYNEPILTKVLRVFALRIPLSSYNAIQHAYVSRHMLFKKFFFSTMTGTLLSGVVGIILAYCGAGVWALVAQYFVSTTMDTLVLSLIVSWHPRRLFSWESAKSLMNYGTKILLADLSGTFFGQLRSIVIGKMYTSADLAYYNKGQQLPNLIAGNLSQTIMTVLFPAISNQGDNLERVRQMSRKMVQILSFVLFPLLFGLSAVARPLILFLFTEKWENCVPFIQLLSASAAIGMMTTASLQTIKAIGRSDVVLKLEVIKKPMYILLLVLGVRRSVTAIAVTMVLYDFYGTFVNMMQLRKCVGYRFREQVVDLLPAMVLSSIMVAAIAVIPLPVSDPLAVLLLQVLMGAAIYIAGSMLLKPPAYLFLTGLIKKRL